MLKAGQLPGDLDVHTRCLSKLDVLVECLWIPAHTALEIGMPGKISNGTIDSLNGAVAADDFYPAPLHRIKIGGSRAEQVKNVPHDKIRGADDFFGFSGKMVQKSCCIEISIAIDEKLR